MTLRGTNFAPPSFALFLPSLCTTPHNTKICRRGHLLLNGRHLNNLLHLSEADRLSAASTDSEVRPYGAAALVRRRGEVGAPLLKGQKPAIACTDGSNGYIPGGDYLSRDHCVRSVLCLQGSPNTSSCLYHFFSFHS